MKYKLAMLPNPVFCSLFVFLLGCGLVTRAEVSVVAANTPRNTSLYVSVVVEDPDPFSVWLRQAPQGSPRIVLNEGGAQRGDGPPTMVGNPSGLCVVAWAMHTPTGYDVVYSRFVDDAWTAPVPLANSSLDENDPFLIQGPDGTVHLFYWEAGPVPRVLYRQALSDLSSWTAPVAVSDVEMAASRPAAVFHEGDLYVAYEVHDYGYGQTPRQIVIARKDGETFLREVLAITQSVDPVWPQIHSRNGRVWADWIDAPGQMLWTVKNGATSWTPTQVEPFNGTLQRDFFVRGTIQHLASE